MQPRVADAGATPPKLGAKSTIAMKDKDGDSLTPSLVIPDPDALAAPAISFKNVTFGYNPNRDVLRGVSFDVPTGKTVAVVGPSGCGE